MDFSSINQAFAAIDPAKKLGIWAIIISLVLSSIWLIVIAFARFKHLRDTINKGTLGSMLPAFNTASEVGYGAVIAAGGFDTLPHCGAIITLLSICGLNHRQSYMDIAAVTIFGPLVALTSVIVLGSMFGSF